MKTKRIICVLLIPTLMLTLCGCGLSREAKAAEELIAAIGDVSLDSESAIIAAEGAVAALSDKDRERMSGLDVLAKAREEFDALSDADKVSKVEALIRRIGTAGTDSRAAIDAAKEAYDSLDDRLKESVGNAGLITEAEAAYEEARLTAEAAAVEAAIAAIGEVTADSGEAIENAKALYEAAPAEVQAMIGNLAALKEAETALHEIREAEAGAAEEERLAAEAAAAEEERLEAEAAVVEKAIAAIGEVTADSGEAIENAKALYEAAPAEVRERVGNTAKLKEAEAAYEDARLEAEAAAIEAAIAAIGEVTADSGEAIENAKALYEAAPAEVQAKVDNSAAIDEAEAALSGLHVSEAENRIDEIGSVDLDSGAAIAAAKAALDALTPEEAAAVSNTAALTDAAETYQTALEDHAAELLDGFRLVEDVAANEKIYYPAGWTYYGENPAMNQRCFIRPYIKASDDSAQVRVVYNYTSPNKIYWTGISIYVDDETFTKSFPDEAIVRDHSAGTIWEYCDDEADMDLLHAILNAQQTVWFYFEGPAGLSNYRLSATDVEAIRQTLETYDAMLAAGVQPMA